MPGQHVAGAAGGHARVAGRVHRDAAVGVGHERALALEDDRRRRSAAATRARSRGGGAAPRPRSSRRRRAISPGMRRHDGGRRSRRRSASRAPFVARRHRVQAVGVDDERARALADQLAHEGPRVAGPCPGPARARPRRAIPPGPARASIASLPSAPAVGEGSASVMASGRAAADDQRQRRRRRGDRDEAGAGAQARRRGAATAAPVLPGEPADHEHVAVVALVRGAGPRAETPPRRPPPRAGTAWASARATVARGMPMSATTSSPTWSQAGGSTCPCLGAANVTVQVACTAGHDTSPVSDGDAGRKVDGDHRDAGRAPRPGPASMARPTTPGAARSAGRCRAARPRSGPRAQHAARTAPPVLGSATSVSAPPERS